MKFGDKLRELRDAAGMTRELLAERSGVSAIAIKQYESGARVNIPVPIMLKIAAALGETCQVFASCDYSALEPAPVEPPVMRASGKRK